MECGEQKPNELFVLLESELYYGEESLKDGILLDFEIWIEKGKRGGGSKTATNRIPLPAVALSGGAPRGRSNERPPRCRSAAFFV